MSADPDEKTMTFWEHMNELRSRLIKMVLAFIVGAVVAWFYREEVLTWLITPFVEAWNSDALGGQASLHFSAPAALFFANLKLSAIAGLVVALPFILYQIWAFVAPGMYSNERRFAIPFVVSSTLLFVSGALFGWKVAFPIAFRYLLHFAGPIGGTGFEVKPTVMIGDYLDFVSRMLLAFGATFQIPVLIFFLSAAGIVNYRQLIKFSRYFIVIAFVVAAVITPPDVASQFLLAIPLLVLYAISVGISYLMTRKRVKQMDAETKASEAEQLSEAEPEPRKRAKPRKKVQDER